MSCICHEPAMKTLSCFNCKQTWSVEKSFHEKASSCPQHKNSIAICGGRAGNLCEDCSQAFYIDYEGQGWFPTPVLKSWPLEKLA